MPCHAGLLHGDRLTAVIAPTVTVGVGLLLSIAVVLLVSRLHAKHKRGLFGQILPPGLGTFTTLLMTGRYGDLGSGSGALCSPASWVGTRHSFFANPV